MRTLRLVPLAALLAACASAPVTPPPPVAPAAPERARLPFVDDFERARAEAAARGVPIFVDVWATWCHTCLSMREHVFPDPALQPLADRFVWLEVDTDRPESAAFVERFPVQVWPTLFVLDPAGETALLRWPGSATASQLVHLLEDGERAFHGGVEGPEAALARGDLLFGAGKPSEAAEAFSDALAAGGAGWSRRARAAELLVNALYAADRDEDCAARALELAPSLGRTASYANSSMLGLYCALSLPKGAPRRGALVDGLEAKVKDALGPPPIDLAADDRSSLYDGLVSARADRGDAAGAKALAAEWLAFLEAEASKAPSPEARAVFDTHRVMAAIAAGEPARALPALEASERDLPGDYNAPARKALVLRELGRHDEALAASDRALSLVYGPRKLRVLTDRADLLLKKGDPAAARRALEDARAFAATLPRAQVSPRALAAIAARLAARAPPGRAGV